jgi:serine protease Do
MSLHAINNRLPNHIPLARLASLLRDQLQSCCWRQLLALTVLMWWTVPGSAAWSDPAVARLNDATVRVLSQNDRSSGVVISDDGLVLTCAHGIHGDTGTVVVALANGTRHQAQVVHSDHARDLAVVRLPSEALDLIAWYPVLAVKSPAKDATVLASGFPGREETGQSPVLRVGRIVAATPLGLRSTCTLTSGDSGGPLFDVTGRLAGIHRQIGTTADQNIHIPTERIAEYLSETGVTLPAPRRESRPLIAPAHLRSDAHVRESLRSLTVRVVTEFEVGTSDRPSADPDTLHRRTTVLGTAAAPRLVVTKLSALRGRRAASCVLPDGAVVLAEQIAEDRGLDLALLQFDQEVFSPREMSTGGFGDIVFAGAEPLAGLIARDCHDELPHPVKLGAELDASENNFLTVVTVAPNSFAASGGWRPMDRLVQFSWQPISSFDDLLAALESWQPGDWATVTVQRGDRDLQLSATLTPDPAGQFEKTEYLDGRAGRLSERRTGLAGVIQHDIAIRPQDCGGPLVNSRGELVGINIARRARESTLAVPISRVMGWIQATQSETVQ